jgi:hypothetical protein
VEAAKLQAGMGTKRKAYVSQPANHTLNSYPFYIKLKTLYTIEYNTSENIIKVSGNFQKIMKSLRLWHKENLHCVTLAL